MAGCNDTKNQKGRRYPGKCFNQIFKGIKGCQAFVFRLKMEKFILHAVIF